MQEGQNIPARPEYQAAKTQLMQHLQRLGCAVSDQKSENPAGECLSIISADGCEHAIHIRLLDLDKARSIKLPQSDFDYTPDARVWILLALYMHDVTEPFCYLIPTTVFAAPNDIFMVNDQSPRFRYLSNWEIKVYQKAIPELSRYALQAVTKL